LSHARFHRLLRALHAYRILRLAWAREGKQTLILTADSVAFRSGISP
jgi:hypothetical protein